jgi:hypothetical protein
MMGLQPGQITKKKKKKKGYKLLVRGRERRNITTTPADIKTIKEHYEQPYACTSGT